ncbi:MAG: hypothetical protein KGJ03_09015 [Betaproteobacteria bacterium]|nr:hypothetical protein [Betaproteobacteria bacterium]MBU6513715.1 hypothetical protein [Betaproteobacteria bacterium]MDE1955848.1 hypothetical protein [Betaproteobacteria bacterium]MDE2153832.1 hypothetical protein [Betaproteobacteria bacterium]
MLNPEYSPRPCVRSIPRRVARAARIAAGTALAGSLWACSPALDWRQAGPPGVDILLQYPCKPQHVTQPVVLAGKRLDMSMTGCEAAHMTFALAHADLGDAALVAPALAELRRDAVSNIRGRVLRQQAAQVRHAAPGQADSVELDLAGQAPDGGALREHVLLFAQGAQVFQAVVLAKDADYREDAAHSFSSSVQLGAAPAGAAR